MSNIKQIKNIPLVPTSTYVITESSLGVIEKVLLSGLGGGGGGITAVSTSCEITGDGVLNTIKLTDSFYETTQATFNATIFPYLTSDWTATFAPLGMYIAGYQECPTYRDSCGIKVYTPQWAVDPAYFSGGTTYCFDNGISLNPLSPNGCYGLGGTLTDNTTIFGGGFVLNLDGEVNFGGIGLTNTAYGNLNVTGLLSKGGGSFKIDHPLDPDNKYLYHSFVESDEMMNIYNGNITTDEKGVAIVKLPEYFEALNKDFTYQLTVIGRDDRAWILEEVINNSFKIQTSSPSVKVSWQITGIRQDEFANNNRIVTEVEKEEDKKGLRLHNFKKIK